MSSEVNLVNLCLNYITRNFDIFNSAYNTSHDSQLDRNLNFLQRKYSEYLIEHVSDEEGYLSGNYIEFLINEHLTELDCGRLFKAPWSSVFKKMDEMGHVLEKVSFQTIYNLRHEITDEHCDFVNEIVRKLKNVRELVITLFANDETLKRIATHCRKVTNLRLDYSEKITAEGLKQFSLLYGNSNVCGDSENVSGGLLLKTFSLNWMSTPLDIMEGLFYILENFPTLEHLHNWTFPTAFIEKYVTNNSAKKCYNLRSLDLTDLGDCLGKERLSVLVELCPKLEEFTLSGISDKDEVKLLSKFSFMKDLNIIESGFFADDKFKAQCLIELNDLLSNIGAGLRHLSVAGFSLSVELMIEECRNLETLKLRKPHFSFANREMPKTNMLNNLKTLSISNLDFSTPDSKESLRRILESCPHLEELELKRCGLTDSNVARIISSFSENNTSLVIFGLFFCHVERDLLEKVVRSCSALQDLQIVGCRGIGENDVRALLNKKESLKKSQRVVRIIFDSLV